MFKSLFDSMNDVLDEIVFSYPLANSVQRNELHEKLSMLKDYSDQCIEEWLFFEERISELQAFMQKTDQLKNTSFHSPIQVIMVEQKNPPLDICIVISQFPFPFCKIVWYANSMNKQ